ncbi:MAG: CoA transferase [Hyphomicrobiaceae bacterium]
MSDSLPKSERPLEDVRVLDFSRYLSGPMAAALLGDLGADVIKVERPDGDHYRAIGMRPPGAADSVLFLAANRGKRSIALELADERGRAVALKLIERADVLIENFRPGIMDELGLGWEAARVVNPRLVYVSLSGFGQSGAAAGRPAYDPIVQAMSGLMATIGEPSQPPLLAGEALADVASGVFASWGCLAALYQRQRTGRGTHVDVSMLESLMTLIPTASVTHLVGGVELPRSGNKHPVSAPFGIYRAGQGHFAVAVISLRQFEVMMRAIGRPDLSADPRFASDTLRRTNEPLLAEAIESWAADMTAGEAVARLQGGGVPASEVLSVPQAWSTDIIRGREAATTVDHPQIGEVLIPEQPVRFLGSKRGRRRAAPLLNQHEAEILAEIGWQE